MWRWLVLVIHSIIWHLACFYILDSPLRIQIQFFHFPIWNKNHKMLYFNKSQVKLQTISLLNQTICYWNVNISLLIIVSHCPVIATKRKQESDWEWILLIAIITTTSRLYLLSERKRRFFSYAIFNGYNRNNYSHTIL